MLDHDDHLTAGRHAITVGELADLACRSTGRKPPPRVSAETFAAVLGGSAAGRVRRPAIKPSLRLG